MKARTWLALGTVAWLLAGCGGGGGGSSDTPTTPVEPPLDVSAPTFKFGMKYPEERAADLIIETLGNGSRLLDYAQFATDLVHRFAVSGNATSVTANCAYTGRITLQLTDRDADGRASAGDSITATLENCGLPVLARSASGTLRVDIVSTASGVGADLQGLLSIVDALAIAAINGGPNLGVVQPGTLRGSMGLKWSESATGSVLQALSSEADDLRFTATYGALESTDALRQIDVSRTTRYDNATITSSMVFLFDVGSRGGMLRVRTTQPFEGDLNVLPRAFTVEAEIADGRRLRAARQANLVQTQLIESTGVVSMDGSASMGQFLSVMKDVRNSDPVYQASDKGDGYVLMGPWRDTATALNIDQICEQSTVGGVSNFRADALFQRPVLRQPGLAEAGALFRLQFGRAIAVDDPTLQFRLADTAEVVAAESPTWPVATTAVRHGAFYEIRATEPLRHGHEYMLQSSTDGVNWTGNRVVLDTQGQVLISLSSGFGIVQVDNVVVAATTGSDTATVAVEAPARLRGSASLRDGQSIASYQWEQLSGPTLRLVSPLAAETDAVLAVGSTEAVGEAVLQLTVVDSLGHSDRTRLLVKAGGHVERGAALYLERGSRLMSQRSLETGDGSIFYGPGAGTVGARVVAASEGGTGINFSITPANGQRLAVGNYSGAVMSATPGASNGLVSGVFCNTEGSTVSGSFNVLDVAYADDGTITRLAVDYAQQCDMGAAEYRRGSYRYNSTVGMRP